MNDSNRKFLKKPIFFTTILGIAAVAYLLIFVGNAGNQNPSQSWINHKLAKEKEVYNELQFDLVDPNMAPESIQKLAMIGFQIMINTKKLASDYVGNELACTQCHFAGGNTTGGAQGGISLAGVAAKYPAFDPVLGKVIDLSERINNCFLKSMNGKALPLGSPLMLALVTYLHWISKNLPVYGEIPWLGLTPLSSQMVGDPVFGKNTYDIYCALCHHENEKRGEIYPPPLWGTGSFNEGAGLNQANKLAAFIYWNMPYGNQTPVLSEQQAFDVAAYILSKPRPHLK